MAKEKVKTELEEIVSAMYKAAEQEGYDKYWFYNQCITGDFLVEAFFEKYFEKNEGVACCVDKAKYTLGGIKLMLQTKKNISLQQTYKEYQENGGNIGEIKELNSICYWCPRTIKTSKEAIELFYREMIQKWEER